MNDAEINVVIGEEENQEGVVIEEDVLKGKDGYTPIKGVDYFTETEVEEIKQDIIDNLDLSNIGEIESGEIENGVVLWENPDPTATFEAQQITLSSDDYDYLEIFYLWYKDTTNILNQKTEKGFGTYLTVGDVSSNSFGNYKRGLSYVNDTTYSVLNVSSRLSLSSSTTVDNDACIPVKIVGYKNTMPAVVVKETTEMVEEIYSTEEQVIGKWIDGKPLYRKVIELTPFTVSSSERYVQAIDISGLNIDMVTDLRGILNSENYNWYIPFNYTPNGNFNVSYITLRIIESTNLQVILGTEYNDLGEFTGFVTLEYTKTTD